MAAPVGEVEWSGLFGNFVLCTQDGEAVKLVGVRHDVAAPPLEIEAWVRRVPSVNKRKPGLDWSPMLFQVGTSLNLASKPKELSGELTSQIEGQPLQTECSADPDRAFTEIVTVMKVDARGAETTRVHVDYTYRGDEYVLTFDHVYVACGSAVESAQLCS